MGSFMYVDVALNGKMTKTMLDIKALNFFITSREAKRCGLKVEKNFGQIKVVNLPTSTIMGNF